jgi:glycine cleavage system regulatory protein
MLRHAEQLKVGMIFVTDDRKEDWWRIFKGQTLGPRVELVEEYLAASGKRIHFYKPDQFLKHAKKLLSVEVSDSSVGEVRNVSSDQSSDRIRADLIERRDQLQNALRDLTYLSNHEDQNSRDDYVQRSFGEFERGIVNRISELMAERSIILERLNSAEDESLENSSDDQRASTSRLKLFGNLARVNKEFENLRAELEHTRELQNEQGAGSRAEELLRRLLYMRRSLAMINGEIHDLDRTQRMETSEE